MNSIGQFDMSQSPTAPMRADRLDATLRQFALANAGSGEQFTVQGSMSQTAEEDIPENTWYNVGLLNAPQQRLTINDRALWYRIGGHATTTEALVWMAGEEPQSGLLVAGGALEDGVCTVTIADVTSDQPSVQASHAQTDGSTAIGTLSCEWTRDADNVMTVTVRSLKSDNTVETGDQSGVYVWVK